MELHLNVENFGKIKSAKINISNYTIFVGENNSGKTYLMQLVYGVLKSIPSISLECIEKYMKPNSSVFVSDVDFWETLEKEINFHLDKGKTTLVRNIFHKEIPIHSLQIKIIPDQTETGWIISSLKTEKSVRDILNKQALKVENFQLEPFMEEDECQVSFFIGEKNFSKNITRNLILPRDNFFIDFRGTLSNFLICTIFNIDYTTNSNFLFLPASRTGLQQLYPYFFSEHRQDWGLSGYAKEQATVPPYVAPTPPIILSEPPSSIKPHDSGYPAKTELPQETDSAGIISSTGVAVTASALPTIEVQVPESSIPTTETSLPASTVPTTEATFSTQTCIPTEVMTTEPPNQTMPEQTSDNANIPATISTELPTIHPITSEPSTTPVTNIPSNSASPTEKPVATPLPAGTRFTHIKSKGIYRVKNSKIPTVTFLHGTNSKVKQLTIPSSVTYKGITYHVTTIQPNACKNYTSLKKVTVGSYVTHIGKKAFYGCKQLKRITVKSKCLQHIGANALKKTPTSLVIKVPAGKRKTYQRLWRGKGNDNCVL